jgi:hypothetical protein
MEEADMLADKIMKKMVSFDENLQRELSPTLSHYIHRHKE